MMRKSYLLFAVAATIIFLPVILFSGQEDFVSLEQLEQELLRSNPQIRVAGLRYQAALTRTSREGALPDPRVSMGWASAGTIVPGGGIGEDPNANVGIQLAQEIPYPGKRGLQSGIARKEAEVEQRMLESVTRSQISSLRSNFYELSNLHRSSGLLLENEKLLSQLASVAEARYSVGQAMQQDLIKAGTEVAILKSRLIQLKQKQRTVEAEINALLNHDPAALLGIPVAPPLPPLPDIEGWKERIAYDSPVLQARQTTIEKTELDLRLAKKAALPNFDVMTGYFYQGDLEDMFEFRVEISLPVFFNKKQKQSMEETTLRLSESKTEYRVTEQMILAGIQEAYSKAVAANELVNLYRKQIVPSSKLALESSLASYQTGGVDFLTVLTNFTAIREYEMSLYEQETEYLKAIAKLDELAGTPPAGR